MVRADRDPGDFRSLFSGARSSPRAGAVDDARGRGRDAGVVYEIDAARSRPRLHVCIPVDAKKEMAGDVRANIGRRDPELLSAASIQPQLRDASGRLVCASAPGRRFRGDVCDLADAGFRLAEALRGLEGVAKT